MVSYVAAAPLGVIVPFFLGWVPRDHHHFHFFATSHWATTNITRHFGRYSPDLNPIEQAFAKIKALCNKAAARTVDHLWQAIADVLNSFSPRERAAYLKNSGYAN